MNPIIELQNLSFSYGEASVLTNVNLSVYENDVVGIIGPNGGGKTTLLKLLMGFLKPTSGKIEMLGAMRKDIAYVPQNQRFDKEFPVSVQEVVLQGRLSHLPWYGLFSSADKEAALLALEKVGLADFSQRSFGTLSGGQAQRVLIARALVSNPKLLLLDEPTASVDSNAEAHIYQILQSLAGKMTILMVTHDLNAAVEQVQRVILVQNSVMSLQPQEVCQHFAMGLYHAPLVQVRGTKP
jgi:zinc transport system ATP-binding protein